MILIIYHYLFKEEKEMEKNRENFMENAGDLFYEVKENEKMELDGFEAPAVTASTGFLSIFCC